MLGLCLDVEESLTRNRAHKHYPEAALQLQPTRLGLDVLHLIALRFPSLCILRRAILTPLRGRPVSDFALAFPPSSRLDPDPDAMVMIDPDFPVSEKRTESNVTKNYPSISPPQPSFWYGRLEFLSPLFLNQTHRPATVSFFLFSFSTLCFSLSFPPFFFLFFPPASNSKCPARSARLRSVFAIRPAESFCL